MDYQKKLVEDFSYLMRHKSFGQTFNDWLEIILCALTMGKMEERYLEIIAGYSSKEVQKTLPELFGLLQLVYLDKVKADGGWCDPLGDIFEEIGSKKGKQMGGQFFTPKHICDLCTNLTIGGSSEEGIPSPVQEGVFSDPTCGSGRMLISTARSSIGLNYKGFFIGQDIDRTCVMMSAINFFFHGMTGIVIHGDSLAMEIWGGWHIRPLLGYVTKLSADQARAVIIANTQDNPTAPIIEVGRSSIDGQLQLFEINQKSKNI